MRLLLLLLLCGGSIFSSPSDADEPIDDQPFAVVLGVAQDGGFPQAGCRKACCRDTWRDAERRRSVACLAIIDPSSNQRWIIDATPDFPQQLRELDRVQKTDSVPGLDGILLTHAHVGHYAGLIHLGREVLGAKQVRVFAMPRMKHFLESNGPWEQLVTLSQIQIDRITAGQRVRLNQRIAVVPFLVPHRDEYSETVGFRIEGPSRSIVYLPDIDKWDRWSIEIEDILADADTAYLDGTFFASDELPGRDMSEIPHPFVVESIERFKPLSSSEKNKIRFIHLNHTNPLLDPESPATVRVKSAGHHVAVQGERVAL
ncbi:MAG: MBL fold metallo-hydrolase [Planctomycetota bacterium]